MPTSVRVNDLKINRLTKSQYDAAVQAGDIGENELSIITDINDAIQVDTMPVASINEVGKVYQFIGTTNIYTHGYFYECVSDGLYPATYSWQQVNVQPSVDPLPSQSGNAGKFLKTDGTNASWGKALTNTGNGFHAVAVGDSCLATNTGSMSFGYMASATSLGSVAIGHVLQASGKGSIAIGYGANATADHAIQLGNGNGTVSYTNSDANTVKIANDNGNFEIMSADGTIPEARLANTTSATQGQVLTLDNNLNAVWSNASGGSLPSQTGNEGKFLKTDGINANWSDLESIPQYSELPTPNIDNVYTIAQYSGETNGTFTNGYFYKNNDIPIPAYVDINSDSCYGTVNVNIEQFESIVQLSDGESTTFYWHVEYPDLSSSITQGNFDVNIWDPSMAAIDYSWFIQNIAGEYDESYDNTYYTYIGNDQWDCFKSDDDTQFGTIQTPDFGMCGIDIMVYDELNPGDQFTLSKSGEEIQRWERDGTPIEDEGYYDIYDYGISYNGWNEENSSITITYYEEQIDYEWQQIDVQPHQQITIPVTSVNNQTGAVNITAAGIGATTKITRTGTLYSNAWTEGSGNKQTISVQGVTSNNTILVAPSPLDEGTSQNAWSKNGVMCVAQNNNSLTFMYDSTKSGPNVDIDVNILILN